MYREELQKILDEIAKGVSPESIEIRPGEGNLEPSSATVLHQLQDAWVLDESIKLSYKQSVLDTVCKHSRPI